MVMAKLILLCFLAIFCFALTSNAAMYVVGDTSGWDISSDIDSWATDKRFNVGDVLLFQYSSSHSVSEVTKENFESCNTTDTLRTFSNGNSTVTLSNGGTRYFVCGNKLHCLGGMKLQVYVEDDQKSSTAAGAPESQPKATTLPQPKATTLPQPPSKTNNPSTVPPTSSGFAICGTDSLVVAFLCLTATKLFLYQTRE